jgi:hypothetical protein
MAANKWRYLAKLNKLDHIPPAILRRHGESFRQIRRAAIHDTERATADLARQRAIASRPRVPPAAPTDCTYIDAFRIYLHRSFTTDDFCAVILVVSQYIPSTYTIQPDQSASGGFALVSPTSYRAVRLVCDTRARHACTHGNDLYPDDPRLITVLDSPAIALYQPSNFINKPYLVARFCVAGDPVSPWTLPEVVAFKAAIELQNFQCSSITAATRARFQS